MNYYQMQKADMIDNALENLPTAKEVELFYNPNPLTNETLSRFKGVEVTKNGERTIVACPTKRYVVVQHKDAFRPIIDGLKESGFGEYSFVTVSRLKRATLQLYLEGSGYDTVQLGINCVNSYDGSTAVHYGFQLKNRKLTKKGSKEIVVELVAYRQVCSNGMKLHVPLATEADLAEAERRGEEVSIRSRAVIIPDEYREKLLFAHKASIRHTRSAEDKVKAMRSVVEALGLLRSPVEEYIRKLQAWEFSDVKAVKDIVSAYVGKRHCDEVLSQYNAEPNGTMWDLYNAVTWVASHKQGLSESSREGLLNRAARLPLAVANTIGGDEQ